MPWPRSLPFQSSHWDNGVRQKYKGILFRPNGGKGQDILALDKSVWMTILTPEHLVIWCIRVVFLPLPSPAFPTPPLTVVNPKTLEPEFSVM